MHVVVGFVPSNNLEVNRVYEAITVTGMYTHRVICHANEADVDIVCMYLKSQNGKGDLDMHIAVNACSYYISDSIAAREEVARIAALNRRLISKLVTVDGGPSFASVLCFDRYDLLAMESTEKKNHFEISESLVLHEMDIPSVYCSALNPVIGDLRYKGGPAYITLRDYLLHTSHAV